MRRRQGWRQRWRAPRRLTITPSGRTYLLISFGVGIGALNTGNNLLYLVLGMMLAVVIVSGILSERVVGGIALRRVLPTGCFAGSPFAVRYEMTSRQHGFALRVAELSGMECGGAIAEIPANTTTTLRAKALLYRRGPLKLTGVRISTQFPFGLFEKIREIALPDIVLVWPRRVPPKELPRREGVAHSGDVRAGHGRDGNGDLASISELQPDEDARRIHWKKSAQGLSLLKAERERDNRIQVTLRIAQQQPGPALESSCEDIAAAARQLIATGHDVGLVCGKIHIRPLPNPMQEIHLLNAIASIGFDEPPT